MARSAFGEQLFNQNSIRTANLLKPTVLLLLHLEQHLLVMTLVHLLNDLMSKSLDVYQVLLAAEDNISCGLGGDLKLR